ncbi:MAG TPA: MaoC/PaaZ C-terminal domain-containing protein [Bacillota bacterium]
MAAGGGGYGGGLFYEDFELGQRWTTLTRTVTETDLVQFIGLSGMFERIFIDADYVVNHSPYRRRLVPGALTYAIAEGLTMLLGTLHDTGIAFLGATLTIRGPVAVGDTLCVEVEVIEKRPTSNPERGLVRTRNRVFNQNGEYVLEYDPLRLVRRRPAGG